MQSMLVGATIEILPRRQCPHARSLRLDWADGRRLTIHLDQGFGAWDLAAGAPVLLDGSLGAEAQDRKALSATFSVAARRDGGVGAPLWVTW